MHAPTAKFDLTRYALPFAALAILAGVALAALPFTQIALILGVIVCGVLLWLIALQPVIGVMLTLLIAPFAPLERILFGLPIDSGQAMLFVTLSVIAMRKLILRESVQLPRRSMLSLSLTLFITVCLTSFFVARDANQWMRECLKWVEMFVLYQLVSRTTSQQRRWVIVSILASCALQAAIGIWEFGLRGKGPAEFQIMDGRFWRAYGTFEQPNPFGGYMGITWSVAGSIALSLFVAMWRKRRFDSTKFILALLATVITGMALAAIVASWSRGAWLAAAVAALVVGIALSRKPLISLSATLLISLTIWTFNLTTYLPLSVRARLTDFTQQFTTFDVRGVKISPENYAVIERLAHWQAAQNMIEARLWFGVGFGNYEAAYAEFRTINWEIALGHAHNYYLNIFAETGILGLLTYAIFWMTVIALCIRRFRQQSSTYLYVGLLGAFVHLSVHHIVDNLYVANIWMLLGAYLGLLDSQETDS